MHSSNRTISSQINDVPVEKQLLEHVLRHFEHLGTYLVKGTGELKQCSIQPLVKSLGQAVNVRLVHLGFSGGLLDCVTVINDGYNTDGDSKKISSDMLEAFVKFNNIVKTHAPAVLRDCGMIPWAENDLALSELFEGDHPEGYWHCRLANSLAYRVNGMWALSAIFANVSQKIVGMPFKRGFFHEVVSLNEFEEVVPFTFTVPTCKTVETEPRTMNLTGYKSGTATLELPRGRRSWMHFDWSE